MNRLEMLAHERDHARARLDRAVKILAGIGALMVPPPMQHEGKTFVYRDPDPHKLLHWIAERVRAIPDEIAALSDDLQPVGTLRITEWPTGKEWHFEPRFDLRALSVGEHAVSITIHNN